jgi:CheY-like chemotaxis protein
MRSSSEPSDTHTDSLAALLDAVPIGIYTIENGRFALFSTGHAGEHEVEALLASPGTAFLMKPYSTAELLRTIERLVGGKEDA